MKSKLRALYCPLPRQKRALPNVNIILITFLPHFYGLRSKTNSSRPKLKKLSSSLKKVFNLHIKNHHSISENPDLKNTTTKHEKIPPKKLPAGPAYHLVN